MWCEGVDQLYVAWDGIQWQFLLTSEFHKKKLEILLESSQETVYTAHVVNCRKPK